jgi:hypothetical protein
VVAALVVIAGLFLIRHEALGGLGGYGAPPRLKALASNYWAGLWGVFSHQPAKRAGQGLVSAFVVALPLLGVMAAIPGRRGSPPARFLLAAGLAWSLLFDAPFILVTKPEQMHLVGLGHAMILAGAALALLQPVTRPLARAGILALLVSGTASMAVVSRMFNADFAPCTRGTLGSDRIVVQWAAVPIEIREYLRAKRPACRAGRSPGSIRDLPVIAYGLGEPAEADSGTRARALRDRATLFVAPEVTRVEFDVRRRDDPRRSGEMNLMLEAGGQQRRIRLDGRGWIHVAVPVSGPPAWRQGRGALQMFVEAAAASGVDTAATPGAEVANLVARQP